jgi:ABC-2 type transport system ATP-binding protein
MTADETPAKAPVVAASALVKTFGAVDALDRLDLSVPSGLLMGLVGPDGAGKTTLMRLCAGLMSPTSGELQGSGRNHAGRRGRGAKAAGLYAQRFGLYEDLTVGEISIYTRNCARFPPTGGRRGWRICCASPISRVFARGLPARCPAA